MHTVSCSATYARAMTLSVKMCRLHSGRAATTFWNTSSKTNQQQAAQYLSIKELNTLPLIYLDRESILSLFLTLQTVSRTVQVGTE